MFEDPPSLAILREAPSHDLVVMGTHGRRGVSDWWLGSVAERVVPDSPVPVLVVRAGTGAVRASLFDRIVTVAEAADRATTYADDLARAFGGVATAAPPVAPPEAVRQAGATFVVATLPPGGDGTELERIAEFVRTCERPVLFVPRHSAAAV